MIDIALYRDDPAPNEPKLKEGNSRSGRYSPFESCSPSFTSLREGM